MEARTRRIRLSLFFALVVAAVVAIAAVQNSDAGADGATAEVVQVDEGLVYLVQGGQAIRIQQPRATTPAELAAEGVHLGDEVAKLAVQAEPVGSTFVVVPPDGPDARLHLLVDGLLHPVAIGEAAAGDIAELDEAPVELLWSVRPAA